MARKRKTPQDKEEGAEKFKCPEKHCRKSYKKKSGLSEHRKRSHKKQLFVCMDCEETFTAACSLRRHAKNQHNAQLTKQQTKSREFRRRRMAPIAATDDALLLQTIAIYKKKLSIEERIRELRHKISDMKFFNK